jgi:hypothetical protein
VYRVTRICDSGHTRLATGSLITMPNYARIPKRDRPRSVGLPYVQRSLSGLEGRGAQSRLWLKLHSEKKPQ